jgi:hypothetical protein
MSSRLLATTAGLVAALVASAADPAGGPSVAQPPTATVETLVGGAVGPHDRGGEGR